MNTHLTMFNNEKENDFLVSIIKVEEQEFQVVTNDDLLRLKANM